MKKTTLIKFTGLMIYAVSLAALSSSGVVRSQGATEFGGPLPELTPGQLELFGVGKQVFLAKRSVEEGLGPVFNDFGCAQCHDQPATGGASAVIVPKFGRIVNGVFDPMVEFGGPVRQSTGITIGNCSVAGEIIPPEATVVADRQSQPLFGLGLIENIPESTVLALADPDDRDGDGISGRPNLVMDPITNRVVLGRFGWKAQVPSILVFAADALLNEMGMTTTVFPRENNPQGRPVTCDFVPDPEDFDFDLDGISDGMVAIANFIRFLGPPPRGPVDDAVRAGEAVFARTGCHKCHTPTLFTGDSPVAALNHRAVNLYSDMLLHDIGPRADGIFDNVATGSEVRTTPLWGLRATGKYWHDASAATFEEAILLHGGEAEASRSSFTSLTPAEKNDLIAFLNSL
ncbi:MAG: hypothetical protein HY650_03030 [Acidobacteria bacterium]|nr:hypothetical protein [Acidobacteriota bacterium]